MEETNNTIKLNVSGTFFDVHKSILQKSYELEKLIQNNTNNSISLDDELELFEHFLTKLQYSDYVYPKDIEKQIYDIEKKYLYKPRFIIYDDGEVKDIGIRSKPQLYGLAKWYVDTYEGDINNAFDRARDQNYHVLYNIYSQGVDINYDIDAPNGLNMLNWSITAHGVCSPDFLIMMFKFNRKDLNEYYQKVFQSACSYATAQHLNVFIQNQDKYPLDFYLGVYYAVIQGNVETLHYLTIYYPIEKIKEKQQELLKIVKHPKMANYLIDYLKLDISREILLDVLFDEFYPVFEIFLNAYIRNNEVFEITEEIINNSLNTTDRLYKLELMTQQGFKIDIDNLKKLEAENKLKKPCIRMVLTNAY